MSETEKESEKNCVEEVCHELGIGTVVAINGKDTPVGSNYQKKLTQAMLFGVTAGVALFLFGVFGSFLSPLLALLCIGGMVVAVYSVIDWSYLKHKKVV